MAKTRLLPVLLAFVLLPFSSTALTQDFCVANLLLPDTPAGYPCKPKLLTTVFDFVYHGLAQPGLLIPPFNVKLAPAFVQQFPALNGQGLSATRLDYLPGGVAPLLSHPRATELLFVVDGTVVATFISSDSNAVYTKTLNKGDLFVFPKGLLHFQYNVGTTTATTISVYSNPNPGTQITDYALFGNLLPSEVVEKVTFLDDKQVKKLKVFFGIRFLM